jgi:predicted ATPase/DNA-binding SARP family transcriptional activator
VAYGHPAQMTNALQFRILGPVEVLRGQESVSLRTVKQRTLLAYLLLHRNKTIATSRLVALLWPNDPPATAPKMVRMQAAQLRAALDGSGNGALRIDPGTVRLDVAPGQLDLDRFEDLLASAHASLDRDDPAGAASDLREALAIWRGSALADVATDPGLRPDVARLEELRLAALEDRVDAELRCGRHADLVGELERLVGENPRRERFAAQLMLALYRSGRQVDALDVYRRTRATLVDEVGVEPGPELHRLEQEILRQDEALARPRRPEPPATNVPAPASPLIGREKELHELRRLLLRDDVRLLTLTGAPGSGKTRLGYEVAARMRAAFRDGVFVVELGPLSDAAVVPSAIASSLSIDERADEPLTTTIRVQLRDRRILLVLDNFEHVLDAASGVAQLLTHAPQLKILATSRAPLEVLAEHEYPVAPLGLPERELHGDLEGLGRNPAVALFVERARTVDPWFRLTTANAAAVVETCARLDGLPLAIELAAARLRSLPPAELLSLLDARLSLLTGGARDLPPRQQTLRAALDWSYRLLDASEQALLANLSILAGRWTLAAAEAICGNAFSTGAIAGSLSRLVENSLVVAQVGSNGDGRFAMLETIREYAREKLVAGGHSAEPARRHAEHFARFVEEAEPNLWGGPEEHWWLDRLDAERENIRVAFQWARDAQAAVLLLRLAAGSARYWYLRGNLSEARSWLDTALTHASPDVAALEAKACRGRAIVAHFQGEQTEARDFAERARALYERLGDEVGLAATLNALGSIAIVAGDSEAARKYCEQAISMRRRLDDRWGLATGLVNLAVVAAAEGDHRAAIKLEEEALSLFVALGNDEGTATVSINLGESFLLLDQLDAAEERFRRGLVVAHRAYLKHLIACAIGGLSTVAARRTEGERAAVLLGAANHLFEAAGFSHAPTKDGYDVEATTRQLLGDEEARSVLARGRALDLEDAVALALT